MIVNDEELVVLLAAIDGDDAGSENGLASRFHKAGLRR